MRPRATAVLTGTFVSCLIAIASGCATSPTARTTKGPAIQIDDVERFYRIYGAAGGHPSAEQLQRDYIDVGTVGLHHFARVRNVTGDRIAQAIAARPELYTNARSCVAALPRVRERLELTFDELLELYPQAQTPPVTILVGRGKPLAIAGPGDGVQVAVEAMCSEDAARILGANVEDRIVQVIAHEYVHAQQAPALANNEPQTILTVLERSLIEGIADFVGAMISGGVANVAVHESARGRELEIETRFAEDVDKTDLSDWVDNTTPENVGQLGYWVGYRIASSYYQHASDKRAAIREMIQMTDSRAFLAKSGWYPGIRLRPHATEITYGASERS